MTGGTRASNGPALLYQPPPTASTVPASTVPPVVLPIRCHLAFASTKPLFVHPDDYHRFSYLVIVVESSRIKKLKQLL
ncbi:hypothetical protein ES332_A11G379200v1 [Gossypium tomentosum]|uniref:Uncharacterized protein n=1 Tax=Gossypium tomentosum TaxID=34277 RepID=A0A5D2NP12_GOSTO|nr:hypothetical protein ES332_A11G379200v1 [Gossypium tomentosum]